MSAKLAPDVVFLLDVDNTLIDNDRIVSDLRGHLERSFGDASAARYSSIFEELREELGYADYLGALQRYRANAEHGMSADERLLLMASYLTTTRSLNACTRGHSRSLPILRSLGPL